MHKGLRSGRQKSQIATLENHIPKSALPVNFVRSGADSVNEQRTNSEECEIMAENQDGSLCAHIPVAWIKINPAKQLSEEQRRGIAERFKRK